MQLLDFSQRFWWFLLRCLFGTRYLQLFKYIHKIKPLVIVEIGTWNGHNAKLMIEAASKHHPPNSITYIGFDLFEEMTESIFSEEISKKPPSMKEVNNYLQTTGANIVLFKGDTKKTLAQALDQIQTMDFVFIDGGHSVKTIASDWEIVSNHVKDNTVVIFDDYWMNKNDSGCKPVIDAIDQTFFNVEVLPHTDRYINKEFGKLLINFAKITKRSG